MLPESFPPLAGMPPVFDYVAELEGAAVFFDAGILEYFDWSAPFVPPPTLLEEDIELETCYVAAED